MLSQLGIVSPLLRTATESYKAQIFTSVTPVTNQWKICCVVTKDLVAIKKFFVSHVTIVMYFIDYMFFYT